MACTERYPQRSLTAHMAVIIDEHAGSDGDIFPDAFRLTGLGPLIGTRTWGGVVGIRGDKPFVDLGPVHAAGVRLVGAEARLVAREPRRVARTSRSTSRPRTASPVAIHSWKRPSSG